MTTTSKCLCNEDLSYHKCWKHSFCSVKRWTPLDCEDCLSSLYERYVGSLEERQAADLRTQAFFKGVKSFATRVSSPYLPQPGFQLSDGVPPL